MKCAVHPDAEAIGYCRNCGKPLCSVCARPIRDVYYCEDCLAGAVGIPPAPPPAATPYAAGTSGPSSSTSSPYTSGSAPYVPPPPTSPSGAPVPPAGPRITSPALAFVLGLCVPGLGAIYNGEYNKALIQIVVFAAMIVGLSSDLGGGADTALGLLLAGFVFYMAFDSMRTAKNKLMGVSTVDPLENWSKDRPVGPIILIGVGVLFLLNNFSWFPFYRIERFWPLILIGVGVMMFRNRLGK
jgi:Domain of unknown function (DUF5668)/B-box zinc finger